MTTKALTRNPAELKPHPLFAKTHHPMMPRDTPQWAALVESIRDNGVHEEVKITEAGFIVDGRHRCAAAVEAGIAQVRVRVVEEDHAPLLIAETLIHRRHYTKSARSFLVAPFADAAAAVGKKLKNANLRHNSSNPQPDGVRDNGSGNTLESFAQTMGVSPELLRQARDIHARLDKVGERIVTHPETRMPVKVRDRVEEMLCEEGAGFQPVLAMLGFLSAGNTAQGQKLKDARAEYGRLAADKIAKLTDNLGGWAKVDAVEKEVFFQALPRAIPQWPLEVCQRLYLELSKRRDEWSGQN